MTRSPVFSLATVMVVAMIPGSAMAQSWSTAQPLSPADGDVVDLAPAASGGFHAVYRSPNRVNYRRFTNSLGPVIGVFTSGFNSGPAVAESPNGTDVHVVFENWVGSSAPQVGWARSTNNGTSFSGVTNITASDGCAKWPMLTPYGTGTNPAMLMSYFRSGSTGGCNKSYYFSLFNGASWSSEASAGFGSNSEYDCWGQAWSPKDGSIYRTNTVGQSQSQIRQYNGAWGTPTTLLNGSWTVRQHLAINPAGQVMVMWDQDGRIKSQLFTPGGGPGPIIDIAVGGYSGSCDVASIPGTNQFYMVVGKQGGAFRVVGRRFAGGAWGGEELVMTGLADNFLAYPSLAISPVTGQMYCAWQYHWPDSFAQIFYSVRSAPPSPTVGTLTGTVTDQNGNPQFAVTIDAVGGESAVTDANGVYTMQVPVGTYTVNASKNFTSGASAAGVQVTAGNTTVRNFSITVTGPDPVSSFQVLSSPTTKNNLRWVNPTSGQFYATSLRYRTDGVNPTGPNDGTLIAVFQNTPGSTQTFTHQNLTNGVTYRYATFTRDNNQVPTYSLGVYAQGTPAVTPDFDRDGDVDQSDFGFLQGCLTGPGGFAGGPCVAAMLDDVDSDVDNADLNVLLGCFSGPDVYAVPTCVP